MLGALTKPCTTQKTHSLKLDNNTGSFVSYVCQCFLALPLQFALDQHSKCLLQPKTITELRSCYASSDLQLLSCFCIPVLCKLKFKNCYCSCTCGQLLVSTRPQKLSLCSGATVNGGNGNRNGNENGKGSSKLQAKK